MRDLEKRVLVEAQKALAIMGERFIARLTRALEQRDTEGAQKLWNDYNNALANLGADSELLLITEGFSEDVDDASFESLREWNREEVSHA